MRHFTVIADLNVVQKNLAWWPITQYTAISVVDYIRIPFDFWCFNRSRSCCPISTNSLVWFVSPVLWPFATMLPLSTHMRQFWCRVPGLIWLCNINNTCFDLQHKVLGYFVESCLCEMGHFTISLTDSCL